jgi:hypothetical protein
MFIDVQSTQLPPPTPHAVGAVPLVHPALVQHPMAHEVGSQGTTVMLSPAIPESSGLVPVSVSAPASPCATPPSRDGPTTAPFEHAVKPASTPANPRAIGTRRIWIAYGIWAAKARDALAP